MTRPSFLLLALAPRAAQTFASADADAVLLKGRKLGESLLTSTPDERRQLGEMHAPRVLDSDYHSPELHQSLAFLTANETDRVLAVLPPASSALRVRYKLSKCSRTFFPT